MRKKKIKVRVIEKESGEVLFFWDNEKMEINLSVQVEDGEIKERVLEIVVQ